MKEEWRTIDEYPNYMVSNLGNVKSLKNGKERVLKPKISKNKYCYVILYQNKKQKMYYIHRLVASAFIPNINNLPCVNHKNESKTDNCVSNLEWCSYQYNNTYGTRLEKSSIALKGKKKSQEHIEKCAKARQKPILQFNREGTKILSKWYSVSQASEVLEINQGGISSCLKGKLKTYKGYKWKYLQDYINEQIQYLNELKDYRNRLNDILKEVS